MRTKQTFEKSAQIVHDFSKLTKVEQLSSTDFRKVQSAIVDINKKFKYLQKEKFNLRDTRRLKPSVKNLNKFHSIGMIRLKRIKAEQPKEYDLLCSQFNEAMQDEQKRKEYLQK